MYLPVLLTHGPDSVCHVTTDQYLSCYPHWPALVCNFTTLWPAVCCVTTCICLLCYHTDQYLSVMLPHWPQQPVSVCHVITLTSISLSSALSSICLSCYQHDQYLSVLLSHWPAPDLESALLPHWPVSAVLLPQRKRVRLAWSPRPAHSFVETWSWKHFLRPFSLFRWFKKSSCQLLAKECALSTGKLPRRLAQEQCG